MQGRFQTHKIYGIDTKTHRFAKEIRHKIVTLHIFH